MTTAAKIHALIKEKEASYVDLRFTDMRGKLQHVTFDMSLVDDEFLTDGVMFDGSSISGWKAINESDMKLRPDLATAWRSRSVLPADDLLTLFCDVLNPGAPTSRTTAIRGGGQARFLTYLKASGSGRYGLFRAG